MEKLNYCEVYDHRDRLKAGDELRLNHSIYCDPGAEGILPFVGCGVNDLKSRKEQSVAEEERIFEKLRKSLREWELQAEQTALLEYAIQYLSMPPVKHTSNQWVRDNECNLDEISNMVYLMWVGIYVDTKYDSATKTSVPIAWYVTWNVKLNTPTKQCYKIAGQDRKRYTSEESAMKYISGRKKAYAHLFTEVCPPIPPEHEDYFKVHGMLLPGYTVSDNIGEAQ